VPGLDDQVDAFRNRPLEGCHPYLWLDAKVVKVRDRGHVYPKALVVAYSVRATGRSACSPRSTCTPAR